MTSNNSNSNNSNVQAIIFENVKDFDPAQIFDCGQCFRWLPCTLAETEKSAYNGTDRVDSTDAGVRSNLCTAACTEDSSQSKSAGGQSGVRGNIEIWKGLAGDRPALIKYDKSAQHLEIIEYSKSGRNTLQGGTRFAAGSASEPAVSSSAAGLVPEAAGLRSPVGSAFEDDGLRSAAKTALKTEDTGFAGETASEPAAFISAAEPALEANHLSSIAKAEADAAAFWKNYFDLDRDYGAVKRYLSQDDPGMREAIRFGSGIRILRQDPWETLVSFIISQNNNIPRIRKCIESLAMLLGERIKPAGITVINDQMSEHNNDKMSEQNNEQKNDRKSDRKNDQKSGSKSGHMKQPVLYTLPSPERLAASSLSELAPCRLGYRAEYLIEAGRQISGNKALCRTAGLNESRPFLEQLADEEISGEQAIEALRLIKGVGPKVAACVALFGLNKINSFPVDVWMKRVMHQIYGIPEKDIRSMKEYAKSHFSPYGGIAQQYLFNFISTLQKIQP